MFYLLTYLLYFHGESIHFHRATVMFQFQKFIRGLHFKVMTEFRNGTSGGRGDCVFA